MTTSSPDLPSRPTPRVPRPSVPRFARAREDATITEPMGVPAVIGFDDLTEEATVKSAPPVPAPAPALADAVYGALGDLALFETAVEGAAFCLVTAMRALPSLGGLALLRDPARGDWVVVYAQGPRAHETVRNRVGSRDGVLAMARTRGAPLRVEYGYALPAPARHEALGEPWAAVVVPVMNGDECVAALELVDPLDGRGPSTQARDALDTIAACLAEFLRRRPIDVGSAFAPEQVGLDE